MTKIDVRECSAGPELDAACAEIYAELIGWKRDEHQAVIYYDAPDDSGRSLRVKRPGTTTFVGLTWWQPSTNIKAAWELVEAMLPLRGAPEPEVEPWWTFTGYLEGRLLGPSERVALHICRAFLLAHGVTEIEAGARNST